MLGHKTSLNKFKKIVIISGIFSDCSGMKLEINNRRKIGKYTKCGGETTHSRTTNGSKKKSKGNEKIF